MPGVRAKVKVAVVTRLFAKRDVKINSGHKFPNALSPSPVPNHQFNHSLILSLTTSLIPSFLSLES